MPSVSPLQLLNCIRVLLNEESGGLKGPREAKELARLMTKFSVKCISKNIYAMILKQSTPDLLSIFMDSNGWNLMWTWLKDSIEIDNTMLIQDILTILHLVPVTIEHLQSTKGPKLLKLLLNSHFSQEIKTLSKELEFIWLSDVKKTTTNSISLGDRNNNQDTGKNMKSKIYKVNKSSEEKHDHQNSLMINKRSNFNEKCSINEPIKKEISNTTANISPNKKKPDCPSTTITSVPNSEPLFEKSNYSVNEQKHEKKAAITKFKSKFRNTGYEEDPSNSPSESKHQSKKSLKKNEDCVSSTKTKKRNLSPKFESPPKKKPNSFFSNYQQSADDKPENNSVSVTSPTLKLSENHRLKTEKPIKNQNILTSVMAPWSLFRLTKSPPITSDSDIDNKSLNRNETNPTEDIPPIVETPKMHTDELNQDNSINCKTKSIHTRKRERNFRVEHHVVDNMQPKTKWRDLNDSMAIDVSIISYGGNTDEEMVEEQNNSQEDITETLQDCSASETIYSNQTKGPHSPEEPEETILETDLHSNTKIIPLEDLTVRKPLIQDNSNIPWPEPKGYQSPVPDFPITVSECSKPINVPLDGTSEQESTIQNVDDCMLPAVEGNSHGVAEFPTSAYEPMLMQKVHYGNQVNWDSTPNTMSNSFSNRPFVLPNQMTNNNYWLTQSHYSMSTQQIPQPYKYPQLPQQFPPCPQQFIPLPQNQPPLPLQPPPPPPPQLQPHLLQEPPSTENNYQLLPQQFSSWPQKCIYLPQNQPPLPLQPLRPTPLQLRPYLPQEPPSTVNNYPLRLQQFPPWPQQFTPLRQNQPHLPLQSPPPPPPNRKPHQPSFVENNQRRNSSMNYGQTNTNNCFDMYEENFNQTKNYREQYNQPSYKRNESRVCKYFAKGYCYNKPCPFLH